MLDKSPLPFIPSFVKGGELELSDRLTEIILHVRS
jgi:hypothetical protein